MIERTFGLSKKRWAILRTASFFHVDIHVKIISACCILHNHIRNEQPSDPLLNEVDAELEFGPSPQQETNDENTITSVQVTNEWTKFRDDLAREMFDDYQARRNATN